LIVAGGSFIFRALKHMVTKTGDLPSRSMAFLLRRNSMKEIMTIIRVNKVNQTKEALAEAGFPAFLCRPCLGRGKKGLDALTLKYVLESGDLPVSDIGESMTESARLIPKRFFTLVVNDDQAELAVKTIIKVNQTGNPGDGRVFILPVEETYIVRTGENTL
jgi:nitrogen regulatory protein PII 2